MEDTAHRAIAVVGVGAVLPDAPDAHAFWRNLEQGRYSISEVSPERWDPGLYYDPDPKAPDKTYSKIGSWARDFEWEPMKWHLPIPPKVSEAMDEAQKWAVACSRQALLDYGYPERTIDADRTAVILGNAMAGEKHYLTTMRIEFPEYARALAAAPSFSALPADVRAALMREMHDRVVAGIPDITEDTMPGELGNIIAGRVANLFNFHGPNYVTDAACASAMAAISAAVEGLVERDYDAVLTGGIDRNMGAQTFIKFCKIGALSATGTRPYADGADGFVMGEGAAVFLLKRLEDAERDGDRVYAVLRGIAGASDGRGKGITAPNPVGQRLAIQRAWAKAGLPPSTASLVEGHGTSTRVGDVVEFEALTAVFGDSGVRPGTIPLGSVKSNIGHLKGAAGAAGLLKTILALHEKKLPPSLNFERPNPAIDFARSPFHVNTELKSWPQAPCGVRRAGVSAFGFGGTNFHVVLEEHVPGRLRVERRPTIPVSAPGHEPAAPNPAAGSKAPPRGALVLGADDVEGLSQRLQQALADARAGHVPAPAPPAASDLRARERIAIDFGDATELLDRAGKAEKALQANNPAMWKALRAQGIFRGAGAPAKVAFLYTGQGSQYVNMLAELRRCEPLVAAGFDEADRVMSPLLGRPLTSYIFVDPDDEAAVRQVEEDLRQTAITQPAVLTADAALTRLLAAYGIEPDMVMGHSLGEYGALVAAGALPFEDALEAVSARGREMSRVSMDDNGAMAAVFAPLADIERVLGRIDGYVVIANINSFSQAVVGGATTAVEQAIAAFEAQGFDAVRIPVSHAFHTRIVAPASEPLRATLQRLRLQKPRVPIVANVDGKFYPTEGDIVPQMLDILARQVASPVQFIQGLETLYDAGARIFVEVGPKKALQGFVDDVLGSRGDVNSLFTNHPKVGDVVSFNQALCGLYAAGLGAPRAERDTIAIAERAAASPPTAPAVAAAVPSDRYGELGRLFADFLERAGQIVHGGSAPAEIEPVAVTGAALGLPGTERVFDDSNVSRILHGQQFIDVIPTRFRQAMLEKHITRLVKSDDGGGRFETIDRTDDVIKLAGRAGAFDLAAEYGVPADRVTALDVTTRLAIAAGVDALRDAGIPLVLRYKTTSKGTQLPDGWALPIDLRDDTGVIFASSFPGADELVRELDRFYGDRERRRRLTDLESIAARLTRDGGTALAEVERRIAELREVIAREPYEFDRRFLFRILSMGHSQFAEMIGARGPNTQLNSACASTTQAFSVAEDWIRSGRCRCVIVIAADDVTSDHLLEWVGAGFLATGAAATDDSVEKAALPFDRRRHGTLLGMGAAAFVIESAPASRERGIRPICEVLSAVTANSAFHGTRLDLTHIRGVMEKLVSEAERRSGIGRREMARQMVFVSHETFTPARGGSAAAEIHALRQVFGADTDQIVIANTKGVTGHPIGVGIEDGVAVKALETGLVPPVPNFKEVDPELGTLNLSRGGAYPIEYALRLGAGFGSQISMTLLRHVPSPDGRRPLAEALGYTNRIADPSVFHAWLSRVSGQAAPELQVDHRTLRVSDHGSAGRTVEKPRVAERPPDVSVPPATRPEPGASVVASPAIVSSPAQASTDPVRERILGIVAEKTGYPPDMLDPELDLEADLGIDTVKQAELFAAVREAYGIPRDDRLKLRDFPTLNHVVQFVYDRAEGLTKPAAAPAAPVTSPAGAEPVAAPAEDPVREKILAIVAEKTGYPPDMLDPELDLEADLGIDTVKQAELFAAVREVYGIPRDDKLKLRDFPTLNHVVQFVYDRAEGLARTSGAAVAAAAVAKDVPATGSGQVPRRVPIPVLRPPLELCKRTGVELGRGDRVVVMRDRGGVGRALVKRLDRLGVEVLDFESAPDTDVFVERVRGFSGAGAVRGVYWLPALDDEGDVYERSLGDWREALRVRVKLLHRCMRELYGSFGQPGRFVVAATRLGGRHGYDEAGATAPLGGAVVGFFKTFKRERSEALVKTVDFALGRKPGEIADLLLDETRRDPGVVEVGYTDGTRWTVALREQPVEDGQPGMTLGKGTVFVVTGAAGSITSAITADLAAASGGTFYLLDLVPVPDAENPDLKRFATDKEGLKRDIFERLKNSGERATPARVEKELAALERADAALRAIRAVENAGGAAHYHSVDLRDADSVARAIADVRQRSGKIDVLLHAGGLEISHFLPDKDPAEFDLVFDVKSDGWFNLLHAIDDMPLGATVGFSSIAGRFGNGGQADYAAANDLLCKTASSFRRTRPATRGIAIDWTAWAGIGMATRGSIPKMMEMAGIDMLPPEAGIPFIRHELTAGGRRGEVLVAQRLGILLEEWDEHGGIDPALFAREAYGPMIGRVAGMSMQGVLTVDTELDPARQPFLRDHQIDGTPVLPGVMGVEGFVEIARLATPGWNVIAVEDVVFQAPFKFYRGEPRLVTLRALFVPDGEDLVAECELLGSRTLPNQAEPQVVTHFRGRVRLGHEAAKAPKAEPPPRSAGPAVEADSVYRVYFHGPAYRVLRKVWRNDGAIVGEMESAVPANHEPAELPTQIAPRLIELCFQTAGIWEMGTQGRMALPVGIAEIQAYVDPATVKGNAYAVVHVGSGDRGFDADVVDQEGRVLVRLRGYRTIALPQHLDDDLMQPMQRAMSS